MKEKGETQMQWHMPVGYKVVNGKITIYEEHQKIVEEIFTIMITGYQRQGLLRA